MPAFDKTPIDMRVELTPRFAAGGMIGDADMMEVLAVNFFARSTNNLLCDVMVDQLGQERLSEFGDTYGDLFVQQMKDRGRTVLGLYRTRTGEGRILGAPYVVTNPPRDTTLREGDYMFVLSPTSTANFPVGAKNVDGATKDRAPMLPLGSNGLDEGE